MALMRAGFNSSRSSSAASSPCAFPASRSFLLAAISASSPRSISAAMARSAASLAAVSARASTRAATRARRPTSVIYSLMSTAEVFVASVTSVTSNHSYKQQVTSYKQKTKTQRTCCLLLATCNSILLFSTTRNFYAAERKREALQFPPRIARQAPLDDAVRPRRAAQERVPISGAAARERVADQRPAPGPDPLRLQHLRRGPARRDLERHLLQRPRLARARPQDQHRVHAFRAQAVQDPQDGRGPAAQTGVRQGEHAE